MMKKSIVYKGGYKYQLTRDYTDKLTLKPAVSVTKEINAYIQLSIEGDLVIRKGYAWDGPSGPTIDTKNFMRGSLVHDALYQLIREEHLKSTDRDAADVLLRHMCREDGMSWLRAAWVYRGLNWFGDKAADPDNKRPEQTAP